MYWISLLFVGLLAGVIAKLMLPGRDPGGCIITMVIGLVGALLGGVIFNALGHPVQDKVSLGGLGVAILGSIVLLLIYRVFAGKRK